MFFFILHAQHERKILTLLSSNNLKNLNQNIVMKPQALCFIDWIIYLQLHLNFRQR